MLCIVGNSDSGKTTLITALIREFTRRGLRVGAIKHTHAPIMLDMPGKDSARMKDAGAATVLVASPERIGLVADLTTDPQPEETAARFFPGIDIILVEGWKESNLPKVAVAGDSGMLKEEITNIVAEIRTNRIPRNVPVFEPGEIEKLADFLLSFNNSPVQKQE